MEEKLILSTLPKTWIFDLDGTLVKHNDWWRRYAASGCKRISGVYSEGRQDYYIYVQNSRIQRRDTAIPEKESYAV